MKFFLKIIWCLSLLHVIQLSAFAQSSKFYTVDNELSSSLINRVYQDKHGLIWIATEDGLNKYDGAKFTTYRHDITNPNSIADNYILSIFEDKNGHFFVGSCNGLQEYDYATDHFTSIPFIGKDGKTISNISVNLIFQMHNGNLIAVTSGLGLYHIVNSNNTIKAIYYSSQLIPQNDIADNDIANVFEDHQHNLWISSNAGENLYKISPEKKIKLYQKVSASCFCQDTQDRLYVGSLNNGLYIFDASKDQFNAIPYPKQPHLPVKTLYVNNPHEIYVGTDGCGVKILNTQTLTLDECKLNIASFDLNKSKIHSMIKDKANNMWIGFYQKGIMMLPNNQNQFQYIGYKSSEQNQIGSNSILSVLKDKKDNLWIGTDNDGIYKLKNGKSVAHFEHHESKASVPQATMCIYEDSNQTLWLGSYLDGMLKMNGETGACEQISQLKDHFGNTIQSVYAFAEDHEKRLWIATMGAGLYCMDLKDQTIKNASGLTSGKLSNDWINCLYLTKDEQLYIGTCEGVCALNLKTMRYKPLSLSRNHVIAYCIYEDTQHHLWVGTNSGLFHLDVQGKELALFTTEEGLPTNSIYAIQGDDNHHLWLSSNKGLSRFTLKDQTFQNYFSNNGLQGNEFSKNSSFKDENGILYFGGINGLTFFNPKDITNPSSKIEIRLADIYLFGKPIRKGMKSGSYEIINTTLQEAKVINLCHNDHTLMVEFCSLDFNNNQSLSYLFSVNNGEWTRLQAGTNKVSFSNLSPGTYHLKYKAIGLNSSSDVKEITIVIHPAWYASGWAMFCYMLLAIGLAYYILMQYRHRLRTRQEMMEHIHAEQINEAKLQLFINISHEIRTPMTLIISPLQKLIASDKDSDHQKSYQLIYRNANRILQLVNQLMDIRKIDKGQMVLRFKEINLVDFIKDITDIFSYQVKTKNIELTFTHDSDALNAWVDPKNFDKILVNLLSNAYKFTPKDGKITIQLRKKAADAKGIEHAELIVSDNGIGIQQEDIEKIFERFYQINNTQNNSNTGTGIGLHLTRSLVEMHHGTITVANNEEAPGCHFTITIPLGKAHLKKEELDLPTDDDLTDPTPTQTNRIELPELKEDPKTRSKTKKRILIVEDDEEIRNYIRQELSRSFHIQECCNGKEALTTILKNKPDLVISDVMMPEMDGMTLCKKIKQNVNINYIPVILLTAKTREEDNMEGLEMGADAYITKPFNIEILQKTVENLLKGREILRNCFTGNQEQEERMPTFEIQSTDNKLLDRIMNVINRNISNPNLNVEMIASEVGISRVHLHRKLKELTNQSTRDLIRNVRLKQAAELLIKKHGNVSEVAELTGFTNIAIFSRAFKDLYGMPPTAYVEEAKKSAEQSE